jgi:hypothetical protein
MPKKKVCIAKAPHSGAKKKTLTKKITGQNIIHN